MYTRFMISSRYLLWASLLFPIIQATGSQPSPTSPPTSATHAANISHITIPIYCSYARQYFVKVANEQNQSAVARIDYLQPELWVIDGQHLLECDVLYTLLIDISVTTWLPSQVTYDHSTYAGLECFWDGAFYPTQTITTTIDSVRTTVIQTQQTGDPFELDYANGVYATGVTATANITIESDDSKSIKLNNYSYFLATDMNRNLGGLGLGRLPDSAGFLGKFVEQNMILANSYSIFYFNEADNDSFLAGYLLPGSVDKSLYTGDFYSFPMVPYVGWSDLNGSMPIIFLDDMELENLSTGNKAKVYEEALAVVIDPLLDYSYLPFSAIVNIAIQTNAFYSASQDLWVVKCSDIENTNAVLNLNFGPLSVQIPLSSLLKDEDDIEKQKFASGEAACKLNVIPSDNLGFPCIGSPMLRFMYMAVDNEGHTIALANANQSLSANDDARNSSSSFITAGKIPFATTHFVTTSMETFTFYQQNFTTRGSIPARLSQVQLNSNGVYITEGFSYSQTNSASAAQAASTTGGADQSGTRMAESASYLMCLLVLLGTVMGFSFV